MDIRHPTDKVLRYLARHDKPLWSVTAEPAPYHKRGSASFSVSTTKKGRPSEN